MEMAFNLGDQEFEPLNSYVIHIQCSFDLGTRDRYISSECIKSIYAKQYAITTLCLYNI